MIRLLFYFCVPFLDFFFFFDSSSAAECPWLESSSKASLSNQISMGNTRQPGGYIVPSEFSSAVQDVSLLSHFQTPGLQVVTLSNLESSPAEPHQDTSSSGRAYLSYSARDSSSPREETQTTCIANASTSKTLSPSVASADDSDFLTQNLLTVASGHNSQNSAVPHYHGGNLHAQPPLPEKKRSSEGERSFASVSPSSSGFSSPHSGSTISIPFPNVLPDFTKTLSPSPVPGRFCIWEMQNTLDFIWAYKKKFGGFWKWRGKKIVVEWKWHRGLDCLQSVVPVQCLWMHYSEKKSSDFFLCFLEVSHWTAYLFTCQTTMDRCWVHFLLKRAGFCLYLLELCQEKFKMYMCVC